MWKHWLEQMLYNKIWQIHVNHEVRITVVNTINTNEQDAVHFPQGTNSLGLDGYIINSNSCWTVKIDAEAMSFSNLN